MNISSVEDVSVYSPIIVVGLSSAWSLLRPQNPMTSRKSNTFSISTEDIPTRATVAAKPLQVFVGASQHHFVLLLLVFVKHKDVNDRLDSLHCELTLATVHITDQNEISIVVVVVVLDVSRHNVQQSVLSVFCQNVVVDHPMLVVLL